MDVRAIAFVLGCGSIGSTAQVAPESVAAAERWQAERGKGWRFVRDRGTGRIEFLGGGRVATGAPARDDAGWFARARAMVVATEALTGVAPATLVEERVKLVPLGLAGGTDKLAVRFRQELAGVPVRGGFVNVLFDPQGGFLALQTTAAIELSGLQAQPAIDAEAAAHVALTAFEAATGLRGALARSPELVVLPRAIGERAALAWEIDVQWHAPDFEPEGFVHWIDARDGALLRRAPSVQRFDVGGTVASFATPGTKPDTGANPPRALPMKHLRVSSAAGTVHTDANGAFLFPGVAGPLLCTFEYTGVFADVDNDAGAEHAEQFVLSGTGNAVTLNGAPSEFVTAQANAFRVVGELRDWIRSVDPGDATADFLVLAVVNLNLSCAGIFNGSSIRFSRAGTPCPNMAYSTVVAHEEGHWLNVRYGTGNLSGGMGEGNADVYAMYLFDTPLVGEDVCGTGCHARDGNNLRQFCGDCCPGCHGNAHADGEVWMGAAWKVRDRLNQTHGDAAGDFLADALFLAWLNVFDQQEIQSVIELQWLTLDDVDGNLDNGTPNHAEIDGGFRAQGFPGHDLGLIGTPLCFGDGTGTPCPCGNEGAAGSGCMNGTGSGCTLSAEPASGGTLIATGAVAGQPGLFFQGEQEIAGGDGVLFGDGLRCCGTNVVRLAVIVPDGAGSASTSGVQADGGAQSGDTRCYQFWYRDPAGSPCGAGFNLSSAVEITWP